MAASQFTVYNKALRFLEERPIASLTENREPVRLLNVEWTDAVNTCLYDGYWNHSIREVLASPDTTQAPQFGYLNSYTKPLDWIKTYQIADNAAFDPLLRWYSDQNNVWYSNASALYVKYVSGDLNFGWNLAYWPPFFTEYVACYLASLLAPRVKQSESKIESVAKQLKKIRALALSKDAMDLPPGKIPYGTWTMSRAPRGSILPVDGPYGGDW
jgi:hypothetical protein